MNLKKLFAPHTDTRVFLDYASSTPVGPEVREAMRPWEMEQWANPSSIYTEGMRAKETLTAARKDIADRLGAQAKEVIFTSGGTESNNLAILGVCRAAKSRGVTPHVITTAIEHSSVLEVCDQVVREGGEVTVLPVSSDGLVSPREVADAIRDNTVLVSIGYANNEIGVIQPMRDIARAVKDKRYARVSRFPYIHTDACQAALYCDMDMRKLGVDMATIDGIKIYGPRAAGLLVVHDGVEIDPIIFGGGQERGLRSGTESVTSAVGLAKALEVADRMREKEASRLSALCDDLIGKILVRYPTATINGSRTARLPNNVNICFPGSDAEFVVVSLDVLGIAVSYSSSCRTLKEDSSSYVVDALGKPECKNSSLRITFGRDTTAAHIDSLVSALGKVMSGMK